MGLNLGEVTRFVFCLTSCLTVESDHVLGAPSSTSRSTRERVRRTLFRQKGRQAPQNEGGGCVHVVIPSKSGHHSTLSVYVGSSAVITQDEARQHASVVLLPFILHPPSAVLPFCSIKRGLQRCLSLTEHEVLLVYPRRSYSPPLGMV